MDYKSIIAFDKLQNLCARHHISKLAIFGSVLRPDFHSNSDIDILVEFKPGKIPGLAFFEIQDELSRLTGHEVDLNTPASLSPYFRDRVMSEAQILYNAA